jgi:hypothetical protein
MLKNQIYNYEQSFQEIYTLLVTSMTELQRDANRDFTPTIVGIMHTVYNICTEEYGIGSFMRMKGHMNLHVNNHRHHMFNDATATVRQNLDKMCKNLQSTMESKVDEIFDAMRRDYLTVLGGAQFTQDAVMSKEERAFRADIKTLLSGVDNMFKEFTDEEVGENMDDDAGRNFARRESTASKKTEATTDSEPSNVHAYDTAVEKTDNEEMDVDQDSDVGL